jgi:hypothetical protein
VRMRAVLQLLVVFPESFLEWVTAAAVGVIGTLGASLSIEGESQSLDRALVASAQLKHLGLSLARALGFCISRLAFGAFLLLTSVYCLLVWVPFSYFGFIRDPLISWIPVFVRLHATLYAAFLVAVGLTLISGLSHAETRRSILGFYSVNSAVAIYLLRDHTLAKLQPDYSSYIWCLLSLFPVLWLSVLDLSGGIRWLTRKPSAKIGGQFLRAAFAGVMVSVLFALTSLLRAVHDGSQVPGALAVRGLAISLSLHVVLFTAIGLALDLVTWITRRAAWPEAISILLTQGIAWWLMAHVLRTIILPTISFEGIQADIFAGVVSFVLVLFATSFAAGLLARISDISGCNFLFGGSGWFCAFAVAGALAVAYAIPVVLGRTDWDFVLQRIAVIALWLLVWLMAGWSGFGIRSKHVRMAMAITIACATAGFLVYAKSALYNPYPTAAWESVQDGYSGVDISFKTAGDILSQRADSQASHKFYEFLKRNTNLDRSVTVGPVNTNLVSVLLPSTESTKPNIFIFVIDSLRQDFISPYNPAVDYTPQIGAFARDSVVLENAYTRYGGTALSEPAIWAGAMQLHKQYIEPFYPMNNLQKLLDVDGYHSYISVDPILRALLHSSSSITELDKGIKFWGDLDFVPTLKELEDKIDARSDRTAPIFAYTQPQNVHTLTLQRSKIPGGRRAVSIFELRRMDMAFGKFLDFLRQRGLYDNSIIILTADHGDCYGEFGRWGHSVYLFPQVIRIPLIFHLPSRMRQQFVAQPRELAFSTDITPSLYYLLGHQPIINNDLLGRPLFTKTQEEQKTYERPQYLLVSSYAPVYGILTGDGKFLFIADAVNSRNYYYNLFDDREGTRSHVTMQVQKENEALIRHYVGAIDDFYHWHPGS